MTSRDRRRGSLRGLLPVLLAAALVAATLAVGTGTAAAQTGATVKFALPPATTPNYIFPMMPGADSSNANSFNLQQLLFRPLYWFGLGNRPVVNYTLSLAYPPVYSDGGRTVTINLKPYRWSDGYAVTSRDVGFWMNLLIANKQQWFAYVPGAFPDNVARITYPSPTRVVMTFNRVYNPQWLLYTELSQISPLPQQAWDRERVGGPVGNYDQTPSGAAAVYRFLNAQSTTLATYDTNPLWKVVDGPWRLVPGSGFDPTTGYTVFEPNPAYSGPYKARISRFVEVPFTSDTAEFDALRAGEIQYGYLPPQDLSQRGYLNGRGYRLSPWYFWGFDFIRINFPSRTAPFLRQLYFRQAMQHLIDQPAYITHILKGYAYPTYGPVPTQPPNPFASAFEKANPYPFNVATARSLLVSHGWSVKPSGTSYCARPGSGPADCGAGIRRGLPLNLVIQYATGTVTADQQMQTLESDFSRVGIHVRLRPVPFNESVAIAPCNSRTGSNCQWNLDWDGGGWSYSPDFYPTGGEIFETGAGANKGGYNNAVNNANIVATHDSRSSQALFTYQNYLARQLPALWLPTAAVQLSEISSTLLGALPQDPNLNITPETWSLRA